MRYLLDTGIASDFINRRRGVYEVGRRMAAEGHKLGIGTPVLGELWHGICNSSSRERSQQGLVNHLSFFKIWPFDPPAAKCYGELASELRRRGRKMQIPDIQIAAIALSLGRCVVVSKDSDLDAIPDLEVENWSE